MGIWSSLGHGIDLFALSWKDYTFFVGASLYPKSDYNLHCVRRHERSRGLMPERKESM